MNTAPKVPVRIEGTPMVFNVPQNLIQMEKKEEGNVISPGHIFEHSSIGKLRCESVSVDPVSGNPTLGASCTVVDNKMFSN